MYLTYDEYTGYGGTLDDATFSNLAFGAERTIDYATFNRLREESVIPEEVKRLMFVLINNAHKQEEALNLGSSQNGTSGKYITSQSNDGVSVTYNGMATLDLYTLCEKENSQLIQKYLAGVKDSKNRLLLYRGLYRGE